jgi:2-amino-4-hydroxy-6-hydroxymethyldihydropteridine diphosphokinase
MKFENWEPLYEEILAYFSFDRKSDEESAVFLQSLLVRDDIELLRECCAGKEVTVCGNGPNLCRELDRIKGMVFAADAAALVLIDHGIRPDVIFSDLDGADERYQDMNWKGTIIVIHAHGDNRYLLQYWVPRLIGPVVGTTQSTPIQNVYNFGGFSDGDRAVFAADELGASRITLIGFDCDDPSADPVKRGKLIWARKLLALLGYAC